MRFCIEMKKRVDKELKTRRGLEPKLLEGLIKSKK